MEECACLCGLGSSRGCQCRQKPQGPPETAAAKGKRCPQKRQRPAETAAAEGKPAPAEKPLEAYAAAGCWVGSGGIASPRPPPQCSLQDLPVDMLVDIFASLPGTDLASLAQVCTKFHHILYTDSIWRLRCREEYGLRENLQDMKRFGMSYREVYAKVFPYRNILGLWKLDYSYGTLLNVVVDGLGITGWTYNPSLHTHGDGPMQSEPSFRIRLTERKSAPVEYMDGFYSLSHRRHLQVQKDRFSIQWIQRDHPRDSPTRLRGERGRVLVQEDRLPYHCLTYSRLYLPPSHPDDLISPGLFQVNYHDREVQIVMLSFKGKYARVTEIRGRSLHGPLQIHLMRRIEMRGGEIFWDNNELSRVVQEMDEQVFREELQQEDGTEESEGHGRQSPALPSAGESGAAALEEQPVPFVLPVGVRSMDQNYPRTCRMCFYGVTLTIPHPLPPHWRCPGVFVLFDENHFGYIFLKEEQFFLFGRVQNTFQNAQAPSPQAFLEMLSNIQ